MIGKQFKRSSFNRVLRYVSSKAGAQFLGGNMIGQSVPELVAEFDRAHDLNPGIRQPVYHVPLSVAYSDRLSDDAWRSVARDYLQEMGFAQCQFALFRHHDRDHDHVHIVASRICFSDGTCVSDSFERWRSQAVIRQLEHAYGLTPTPSSWQVNDRALSRGEQAYLKRTQAISVRQRLQEKLAEVAQTTQTMPAFVAAVQARGISVQIQPTPAGIDGIAYQLDGVAMGGIRVGRAYTFKGLQQHYGISYLPQRDADSIQQLMRSPARALEQLDELMVQKPAQPEQAVSVSNTSIIPAESTPIVPPAMQLEEAQPTIASEQQVAPHAQPAHPTARSTVESAAASAEPATAPEQQAVSLPPVPKQPDHATTRSTAEPAAASAKPATDLKGKVIPNAQPTHATARSSVEPVAPKVAAPAKPTQATKPPTAPAKPAQAIAPTVANPVQPAQTTRTSLPQTVPDQSAKSAQPAQPDRKTEPVQTSPKAPVPQHTQKQEPTKDALPRSSSQTADQKPNASQKSLPDGDRPVSPPNLGAVHPPQQSSTNLVNDPVQQTLAKQILDIAARYFTHPVNLKRVKTLPSGEQLLEGQHYCLRLRQDQQRSQQVLYLEATDQRGLLAHAVYNQAGQLKQIVVQQPMTDTDRGRFEQLNLLMQEQKQKQKRKQKQKQNQAER